MITELLIFTLSPIVVCLPMTDFLIELFSPMDILSSSMQSFPTCDLVLTDAEEWIKAISLEVKEGRSFDI